MKTIVTILRLSAVICSFSVMVYCTETTDIFRVKSGIHINEYKKSDIFTTKLGVVKGARDCGSTSKLLEWRYETCVDSDLICHVLADEITRTSQVDFVLTKNIDKLGVRWTVKSKDGKIASSHDGGIVPNATGMRMGNVYTLTASGGVSEALKGKEATFQYILYNPDDNNNEICAEADLMYV